MSDHSSISPPLPTTVPAAAKEVMPVQEQIQNWLEIHPLQKTSIQFKLAIGASDDPLEHEADTMADAVMRIPGQNFIQRKCSHCEEEEKVQRKPLASFIQRKEASPHSVTSYAISSQINSSKGNGSNIDSHTQTFMQSRFGADFSDVKIHTGGESVQLNRDLNAKAFTVGKDIYFNEGQYDPGSSEGKHLLAHELTHVVQQGVGQQLVSRATYTVGRSTVEIDYGNVLYHDNILEYESEIENRYTGWTGQATTAIHAAVTALTNPQKRWLLYAIDLLTDNPLASLNKVNAVTRLIRYSPTAAFMPLDGYDYRKPVFNFENEVLRVSGWFELALTAGLRAPSSSEKELLDVALNHAASPGAASGSACPATRTGALDEVKLKADIPTLMNAYLQPRVTTVNSRATQTQNISDISPIADIVQREALQLFSPYIGRGSKSHFLQSWRFSGHLQSSTAPGAIPPDVRLAYLANRANGEAVRTGLFQQTNYDSRCQADLDVFGNIMKQMNNDPAVQAQLNTIMSWQSFTSHDDTMAETVINLQSAASQNTCASRWASINTLCHELMHTYVHTGFTGMSHGRRIITEGFTEVLGDQLYEEIRRRATNNQTYRNQFEGGLGVGSCKNVAIPASVTEYGDDGRFALGILAIVGDDRFRAAYFLGQTGLAGLQPKLQTGVQDDPYEKEADAIADRIAGNEDKQQNSNAQTQYAFNSAPGFMVQRKPKSVPSPLSSYNKTVVDQAKTRLKLLEPQLAALEGRKIEIEAERLRVLDDRNKLDDNSSDPFAPLKKKTEIDNLQKLNRLPLDIIVTDKAVLFTVKFHVRFEDLKMKTKFEELKTTIQAGIDLVWKQTLGGVFAGRSFTIIPSVTLIEATTPRDQNYWLVTVRSDNTPVSYPGCTLEQPDPKSPPTSVTDSSCDGGVMSIPPTHTSKPGILGHEMLHLFGLFDRYVMLTDIVPGKKPVTTLSPTRETQGRKDPLGGQDGTILQEDLGFLFDKLGVYEKETDRSTAGLGSIKREVMRLQEIVKLGYDPNSLIPSIIRKDFNDKMIKDAENL